MVIINYGRTTRWRRRVGNFPVLLAGLRTLLFLTGGSQTLLAAGRRDVAVVEVVVLSTVSPVTTELQHTQTDRMATCWFDF